MSDRSSVHKLFNDKLAAHCSDVLGTKTDIKFLYCNAHFLLGLSNCSEISLSKIEQQLANDLGHKFGRDEVGKFSHFRSSESCCTRFIRTACNSIGEKWLSKIQSKINSFRTTRFNNISFKELLHCTITKWKLSISR